MPRTRRHDHRRGYRERCTRISEFFAVFSGLDLCESASIRSSFPGRCVLRALRNLSPDDCEWSLPVQQMRRSSRTLVVELSSDVQRMAQWHDFPSTLLIDTRNPIPPSRRSRFLFYDTVRLWSVKLTIKRLRWSTFWLLVLMGLIKIRELFFRRSCVRVCRREEGIPCGCFSIKRLLTH